MRARAELRKTLEISILVNEDLLTYLLHDPTADASIEIESDDGMPVKINIFRAGSVFKICQ